MYVFSFVYIGKYIVTVNTSLHLLQGLGKAGLFYGQPFNLLFI
ncbi:hypothetical protein HMPREF0658_2247 [Hoylesella marshii DSM 16973 = JCM 13450]|uniref:Uncharacterized protein n=1 Tax=Hoylesella marshii DSM 16973 = JCM 13450 TaxID=862515 RepID=E0NVP2_9BACT|nr:hypothetical protein HMPREF0658_2247 [Hoylesella marshii DSM 16973 = JCM 13450]